MGSRREKMKIGDFNCRLDGISPYAELLRGSICTIRSPGVGRGRGPLGKKIE